MKTYNDLQRSRHCVFLVYAHFVFVTKYRRKVFSKNILDRLQSLFVEVGLTLDIRLIEFNGEMDHVHLLISYPPKVSLSLIANRLKGVSSLVIRKEFSSILRKRLWGHALWSPSYFVCSCGGAPLEIIRQYIDQQETPI